ncbi:MAG: alpha-galactosidase [Clostridia bacterium]|nr:alpha-galactosidase [Clostridia bacterium]
MIEYENGLLYPLTAEEAAEATGTQECAEGVEIYRLPAAGTYKWVEDLVGFFSTWAPLNWRDHTLRQWWNPNYCESSYTYGAPIMMVHDAEDRNRVTVSLSDSVLRSRITVSVDDLNQRDELIFTVTVKETVAGENASGVLLRIDRRPIDWNDAVQQAGEWIRSFARFERKPVPDNAALPLYSSWYNFHQEPEQKLLTKELEAAARLGFKTFILDDGWQFEGNNTGDYEKCGDWHVAADKFYDFKAFCDKVHSLGIKILMWFPVPFIGYLTEDYKRLKDKMAYNNDACGAGVLDIRYPEMREFIKDVYKRYVRDFGIDGLKLDFIDAFNATPAEIAPFAEGMDTESLETAARMLLDEIYNELTEIDPEFMFEFRQNYIGVEMVNHCNMLRVCDCAADSVTNRVGIAALRSVNATTPTHSDMLLWGHNETPLNCRRQLLNIMFSVPQISVRLTEMPEDHIRVISCFVDYWTANRDVLLNGGFKARRPDLNYTLMSSGKNGKRITVLYGTALFEPCGCTEDVFNNTESDFIVSAGGAPFEYEVFDIYGEKTARGKSDGSAQKLPVARGGMIRIVPAG